MDIGRGAYSLQGNQVPPQATHFSFITKVDMQAGLCRRALGGRERGARVSPPRARARARSYRRTALHADAATGRSACAAACAAAAL